MVSQDQINTFFDVLKSFSKKDQTDFDFFLWKSKSNQISVVEQKLKKHSSSEGQQLNLRILRGNKSGYSYTKKFSSEGIKECYEQALKSLEISDTEERGRLSLNETYQDFNQNRPKSSMDISEKIEKVKIMDKGSLSLGDRIRPVTNLCLEKDVSCFYGNSHGNQGSYSSHSVMAYSQVLAVDKDKRSQSSFYGTGRSYKDIEFKNIGEESARRSLEKLDFIIPPTGTYPVIFKSGQAVSTLLTWLVDHLSGRSVFDGRSLLKDKLNEKKFSSSFSLYDQPLESWGLSAVPFDEEGFCSQNTTLIQEGVICNYLTDTFLSQALKLPHTAKSSRDELGRMKVNCSNLAMKEGSSSFDDLIQEYPQVIVIDNLKGFAGYNMISGDFSIESEGFLWDQGESRAICQFTVSGNLIDIFAYILKVANDSQVYNGDIKGPSFLVPSLSIAGS